MSVLQLPWLSLGPLAYIELAGLGSELLPSCQIEAASNSLPSSDCEMVFFMWM